MRLSSSRPSARWSFERGIRADEISRVRATALLNRSDVARMSDPHAEMSTAGVIIADRTEVASGKLVILSES
jgi:hypothetical protein